MSLLRRILSFNVSNGFVTGSEPVPEEPNQCQLPSMAAKRRTEPVRNRSHGHLQVAGDASAGSEKLRFVGGVDIAILFLKALQRRAPCTLTFVELFDAYKEFLADRDIPFLPWDSFARHFNKLIQQKGKSRQTRMRILNPQSGRRENKRVYHIPVWKPNVPANLRKYDGG